MEMTTVLIAVGYQIMSFKFFFQFGSEIQKSRNTPVTGVTITLLKTLNDNLLKCYAMMEILGAEYGKRIH